ncbi:uncharacterized protein IWZ02DRAFT_252126 [Phyllosticta citriasiana]|uniref:uncharacterized protein n=1 Tax=Phyllosticta citriasiana TaxID=595635 RepID=UPI0030FD498C
MWTKLQATEQKGLGTAARQAHTAAESALSRNAPDDARLKLRGPGSVRGDERSFTDVQRNRGRSAQLPGAIILNGVFPPTRSLRQPPRQRARALSERLQSDAQGELVRTRPGGWGVNQRFGRPRWLLSWTNGRWPVNRNPLVWGCPLTTYARTHHFRGPPAGFQETCTLVNCCLSSPSPRLCQLLSACATAASPRSKRMFVARPLGPIRPNTPFCFDTFRPWPPCFAARHVCREHSGATPERPGSTQ